MIDCECPLKKAVERVTVCEETQHFQEHYFTLAHDFHLTGIRALLEIGMHLCKRDGICIQPILTVTKKYWSKHSSDKVLTVLQELSVAK